MSALGAARTRAATRESFFGGPLSTREQSKAPGWTALVKPQPDREVKAAAAAAAGAKGGSRPGSSKPAAAAAARPQPLPVDPEKERLQKLKQRRDFSGLDNDDAPPPPPPPRAQPAGRQQQTAAGPPATQRSSVAAAANGSTGQRPRGALQAAGRASPMPHPQQQQQQAAKKVVKRSAPTHGGGGKKASAARAMAVAVTAVGKGRKQLASEALQQRVSEMVAAKGGPSRGTTSPGPPTSPAAAAAAAAGLGSPGGSTGSSAAAAAAAARAAREAAHAKAVMQTKQYRTATGIQTLQLMSRAPGRAAAGARAGAGAAAAAGAAAGQARQPASSPGSVTKGQRLATGAGAPRAIQQRNSAAAAAGGGRGGAANGGRPQFRGAFYGGKQPPAALEARMQYNKRRLSLDSGGDLDSFIASDEEDEWLEGEGGGDAAEQDWRAALREATGGYDPSKFAHIDKLDDRDMEAAYGQIQAEERRALRIARAEDEREAEAEARREAAKRERKRAKRSKGAAAFVDFGD